MNCTEMEYVDISLHIPHVMQILYDEEALSSTSLVELRDAFRPNQMQCKAWLFSQISKLNKESRILVIGSWIGFTSYCLYKMGFRKISEVDIDPRLEKISKLVNSSNSYFSHYTCDINDFDLSTYDLIINTSCEHILDNSWFNTIRPGSHVVLQSTNIQWHDHTNIANSVNEFKTQYPLKYSYADELKLNDLFSRYMIIGEKL